MSVDRRKFLALVGGGVVLAAGAVAGQALTRQPKTALAPWSAAGGYDEPRRRALSWALLAPNPHNRQPWLVNLREAGEVTLYADLDRLLPHTDPPNRQVTIGLGCFLELMRMAAASDGYRVEIATFPDGEDPDGLDARPVARARFVPDPAIADDPLFAFAPQRRTLKEPYDLARPIPPASLASIAAMAGPLGRFGGSVAPDEIAFWRSLTSEAFRIEFETPHTFKESVDLFRIGHAEIDAEPDGIDLSGPLFEGLRATGLFTRERALDPTSMAYRAGIDAVLANAQTGMGYVWLVTEGNTRADQLRAGRDWLRINLATTALGIGFQPMSQALQEFPEMADLHRQVHARLAPDGGTVQMLARIGYGPSVGASPRWPLEARIIDG
ncbi:Acg family FMN-binding oxidoreductase [Salinarimonas sp.]|uniref:Acg family FMN-binding oxidoreductase n=1 Tax=Salinarimonas sp. TaxID=2766526 RepID=UPI00391D61E6